MDLLTRLTLDLPIHSTLVGVVLSKETPLFPNQPILRLDNIKVDPLQRQTMMKDIYVKSATKETILL
jgi:hypothetical protein